MLDVLDFIAERGGDPKKVMESQRRRYASADIVEEVTNLWQDAHKTRYKVTQVGAEINKIQKEIGQLKKNKQDATELLQKKVDLEKEKKTIEDEATEKEKLRDRRCKTIGNYVHDSVPVNDNEDFNEVVKKWAPEGMTVEKKDCLSHHEVMTRAEVYDPDRGTKLVGHRGYFLRKWGVLLNQAIINYGLHFLTEREYEPIQPPFFMKADYMGKTAQLEQFDEEKPLKFAGYSTCFRKEAGAHGRDAWGLYRVHQFEKIEQFLFTKPSDSWAALEHMLETAEAFYQSLGLAYRVVVIVSGALNNAAAKKYDLEAWFPHQGEYKELVSCSNCTDYQTRELEVRYGQKKGAIDSRKTYAHALNGTLCATSRTLCCLLENYQTDEGFRVPEAIKSYMPKGTPDVIPYTKELPKDTVSSKTKGGKGEPKKENKKPEAPEGGAKRDMPSADAVADKLKDADIKS